MSSLAASAAADAYRRSGSLASAFDPASTAARPATALQEADVEKVSLRVTSAKWGGFAEVDRGALGAATHLARLVPPLKMRAMVLTCEPATAEQLHAWGSVHAVVAEDQLAAKAREVARTFTKKIPRVVRVAKECLNNIDPIDVNRSYRFEQGFTFELNLAGVADEARTAVVGRGVGVPITLVTCIGTWCDVVIRHGARPIA